MAVSQQKPFNVADDYHSLVFVIGQLISGLWTAALVKVVACTNTGGVARVGFVDVVPLIGQVSGDNEVVPHGTIYRLPYFRVQGGANAVILDPQAGDIGLAVFASRDISAVKNDPETALEVQATPPGSARQYDASDGLYFGGFLNAVPTQYVRVSAAGVHVVSPTQVTIQAPTITLDGDVHITGETTGDGAGEFEGTDVHTHVHSGVTAGGGNSGPPV